MAAIGLRRHHVFDDAERLRLMRQPRDQRQHAGGYRLFLLRRYHQTDRRIVQQALQGTARVVAAQRRILWAQLAIQSQQAVEIVRLRQAMNDAHGCSFRRFKGNPLSSINTTTITEGDVMSQVSTFVMFQGEAQQAIDLYSQVFERFRLMQVQHYDPTPDGRRLIKHATIDFDRQNLVFIDSPISHDFSFTPAVSLFINLPNEEALERAFHRLAEGGKVLMPLDDYGFSARFGWLNDRFGLSWQLNVPAGDLP